MVWGHVQQAKVKDRPAEVWKGIQKFSKGPCIVIAPQYLKKSKSGERGERGERGIWAWAVHDTHHFAVISPIVGGIGKEEPKDVTPEFDPWATNLTKIPVYAFVGALDTSVPPERSERMIAAIQAAGGKVAKLRVYPDEGHGAG